MRKIDFTVTADGITPVTANLGNAGEHNVTQLTFNLSSDIATAAEYYRLSVGNFKSAKLYAENSKVSFSLPEATLSAGTVLLQLSAYKTQNGEISLLFKSGLVTATVGASVLASEDIPKELERSLDSAVAELDELIEKGELILKETADNRAGAAASELEARNHMQAAKVEADLAAIHSSEAKNAEAVAKEQAELATADAVKAQTAKQEAETAKQAAEVSQNLAGEYATAAELHSFDAVIRSEDARAYSEFAQQQCIQALQYSESAAESAEAAEGYSDEAASVAENIKEILLTGELILHNDGATPLSVPNYYNETGDGEEYRYFELNESLVARGKYRLTIDAVYEAGAINKLYICSAVPYETSLNQIQGCAFDLVEDAVDNMNITCDFELPEDFPFMAPLYFVLESASEVFLSRETIPVKIEADFAFSNKETISEIESNIGDIETNIGDIETALDGIITLQEELIGGGSV